MKKIAFAVDENKGLDSLLSQHFGRCLYYIFVELDENKRIKRIEAKRNPFFQGHAPGLIPQFIAEQGADTVVAGGMGWRAIEWFRKLGIKPITTEVRKVKDILNDLISGKTLPAKPCDRE